MLMTAITFLSALSISIIAIYYSVAGLAAIFAAAVVPIIIMGVALEIGKLVTAVWLHRYWKVAAWWLKTYLSVAVVILMFITSMGIFGFLSKAHMDQTLISGDAQAKIAIYDEKIKTQRDNIETARKALTQMDAQVNEVLSRSSNTNGAERAVQIRRQQAKERERLQADIAKAQNEIAKLNEERAPIAAEVRKVEAEVGPIKYIAEFIYGSTTDQNMLEEAVRWVIVILIFVFDPLAVLLLIASQYTWEYHKSEKKRKEDEEREMREEYDFTDGSKGPVITDGPEPEPTNYVQSPWPFKVEEEKKEEPIVLKTETPEPVVDTGPQEEVQSEELKKKPLESQEQLEEVDPVAAERKREEEYNRKELSSSFQNAKMSWKSAHPDQTLKMWKNLYIQGKIDKLPWEEDNAGYKQNSEQGEGTLFNKIQRKNQ